MGCAINLLSRQGRKHWAFSSLETNRSEGTIANCFSLSWYGLDRIGFYIARFLGGKVNLFCVFAKKLLNRGRSKCSPTACSRAVAVAHRCTIECRLWFPGGELSERYHWAEGDFPVRCLGRPRRLPIFHPVDSVNTWLPHTSGSFSGKRRERNPRSGKDLPRPRPRIRTAWVGGSNPSTGTIKPLLINKSYLLSQFVPAGQWANAWVLLDSSS